MSGENSGGLALCAHEGPAVAGDGQVLLSKRLRDAELENSRLECQLELYMSEAAVARRALEECVDAARTATSTSPPLSARGKSPRQEAQPADCEIEAAALAEALLASELALEAALAEHARLRGELEEPCQSGGALPRHRHAELPESSPAIESELNSLRREVQALCHSAATLACIGEECTAFNTEDGILEDGREAPGDDIVAPTSAVFSAVGELSREVRRSRTAVRAAETRGCRAVETAEARCDVLRQELAQREVQWAEREKRTKGEIEELRLRHAEARSQLTQESAHDFNFTTLIHQPRGVPVLQQ